MAHGLGTLEDLPPLTQTLLAGIFTWSITALGAALVFFLREMRRAVLDAMLGFAAGVMIAASFWSLLFPAIELARDMQLTPWAPVTAGFLAGGAFLWAVNQILPHLHAGFPMAEAEGPKTTWDRSILVVLAITLHNIPEGLAVGVAFGAASHGQVSGSLGAAVALTIGIGLQNFPEGVAVAMPLRHEGMSRLKSFWYGQLSAVVEPVAAILGAMLVVEVRAILPYALAFAAGAMIYVVVEELIPESQRERNTHVATLGAMLGFAVMMVLDVALG